MSHYKLAGQEEVLTNFLLEIGKMVEEVARNRWGILESSQIANFDPIEVTLPKVNTGKVSQDQLQVHLMAAAGQVNAGGENPQWPSHNAATWPTHFSERAAKGLSQEINAALSVQNNSITSISNAIQESIGSYLANLKPYLEQVSSSVLQGFQSLNRRSDLLWWKQALYSPKLDSGYRALDPLSLTVAMAVDLTGNVSPIYPKSVDYFLEETLRDVLGDEIETRIALPELLGKLLQLSNSEKLLLEKLYDGSENRKTLGACMSGMLKGEMGVDEVFKYTGIDKSAEISLGELTVWLFHDLQANLLATAK